VEELIDTLEDYVMGQIAKERAHRKDKKLITLEEAKQKLGLR